jgi:CO/xanthine dehydrogenase FAD-binding subunit
LSAALDLLASQELRIAAGCTDLFPATERKHLQGPILDITGISALRDIQHTTDGVRIGAAVTWAQILRAPLPPVFDGLKSAAREVGARQIQNQGPLIGNLCNASPAADGVPPLLTLDAVIEIQSTTQTRHVALSEFIKGPRKIDLHKGEMATAITIPASALTGAGNFCKLGARDYLVISIAMTAARIVLEDGIVVKAALAIGSCGPTAVRLTQIEQRMTGRPLDLSYISDEAVAAAISPIDDMRADAGYRRISAAELMRRTVSALAPSKEVAA